MTETELVALMASVIFTKFSSNSFADEIASVKIARSILREAKDKEQGKR